MMEIDKIKPTAATTIVISLLCFFGIELMIFLLNRPLFLNLDLPRLISIGLGLTGPMIVVNILIFRINQKKRYPRKKVVDIEENEKGDWLVASVLTIIITSLATFFGFWFNLSLPFVLKLLFFIEAFLLFSVSLTPAERNQI